MPLVHISPANWERGQKKGAGSRKIVDHLLFGQLKSDRPWVRGADFQLRVRDEAN